MAAQSLHALLGARAAEFPTSKIIAYPAGNTTKPRELQYDQLYNIARENARKLQADPSLKQGSVVLIHLPDHLDAIIWYWAVLYAGCVPALSTPLSNNDDQRLTHLKHIYQKLEKPLTITRSKSLADFAGQEDLKPVTIETLEKRQPVNGSSVTSISTVLPSDDATLMLTSGSTGQSKAVCLSHEQIFAAIDGKSKVVPLPKTSTFLNWIGMDHVASIIEIHLQALYLGMDQIHVFASEVVTEPLEFIRLINKHRVSRTFAPNFFLSKLKTELAKLKDEERATLDLSCLRNVASGGEANLTATVAEVNSALVSLGAPEGTIIPGFGMTETCAGAIFNTDCPRFDVANQLEFTSVGSCMPGIEMRVTTTWDKSVAVGAGVSGNLQIRGPAVFKKYYNDPSATSEAFVDGWFQTGDLGAIDAAGRLTLTGRAKETMIVNGVKYSPTDIETALDKAQIPGMTPSYTACFSTTRYKRGTEDVVVIYAPTYAAGDVDTRVDTHREIIRTVMLSIGARPRVLPLDLAVLPKSTLGKLSRSKLKKQFEANDFQPYEVINDALIQMQKSNSAVKAENETEARLLNLFLSCLDLDDADNFDVTTALFEAGISSLEMIKLKRKIEAEFELKKEIPIITLMTNPTVRGLAAALIDLQGPQVYNPVVCLGHNPTSKKMPLWLIHPGVGEILVFFNLAKYVTDRSVYALRARGFNEGEEYFQNIEDAVTTYHSHIKKTQPEGPYAITGYSYGSMLGFEIAKKLESNGDEVRFVGSFNLPPHIKTRMRQLNWVECVLHLSYFLDLITEDLSRELSPQLQSCGGSQNEIVHRILAHANMERYEELAMSPEGLITWSNLAYSLQSMAIDYEPSGSVAQMDIFYCIPLAIVASSKQEWYDKHLSKWADFSREMPRFHEVDGAHYTMIGPDHVFSFQKKLNDVLHYRDAPGT